MVPAALMIRPASLSPAILQGVYKIPRFAPQVHERT
jgi:hypothetical protein